MQSPCLPRPMMPCAASMLQFPELGFPLTILSAPDWPSRCRQKRLPARINAAATFTGSHLCRGGVREPQAICSSRGRQFQSTFWPSSYPKLCLNQKWIRRPTLHLFASRPPPNWCSSFQGRSRSPSWAIRCCTRFSLWRRAIWHCRPDKWGCCLAPIASSGYSPIPGSAHCSPASGRTERLSSQPFWAC